MKKYFIFTALACILSVHSFGQGFYPASTGSKLGDVLASIKMWYVDKVDNSKLEEDAIVSLLAELDPHSTYLTRDEVQDSNESLQGNFDGIGIQFNMLSDTLYIAQVIAGGPSQKVGLMAGDRIIQVDDSLIAGVKMKTTDIMKRLRGPKGTTVRVKVLRSGVPDLIEFKIVRNKIPIYSVEAVYMATNNIGYINISRFGGTTHDEFVEAFSKLKLQGMKSLILDLQGNGGGYLNTANEIADEFLDKNKLIVYTEGAHQKREDLKAGNKGLFEKGQLVVLIDETSASASEIVSGALQDWDRAVLIGRRSFGKGLVQRSVPLLDGSMIRLTTARYYTPTGRCVQKPYESGKADVYGKDLIERYNHGEMMSADSIHFPDSLKFKTLVNGRTVYGGGGVMPDIFIPIDTNRYSSWHRNVFAKGVIHKVCMRFIDQNRSSIRSEYKNFDNYKSTFQVPESLMEELKQAALSDSIEFKESEYEHSESLLKMQFKALIARDVFEKNDYYTQIMNEDNEAFRKALFILNDPKEYERILKGIKK